MLVERAVERIRRKIGSEARFLLRARHRRIRAKEPHHMRPRQPSAHAVRIALAVGMRVMHTMRGYPIDRPALKCERTENRGDVLHWAHHTDAAVRKRAMVAQRYAQGAGNVRDRRGDGEGRPRKKLRKYCKERNEVNTEQ